MLYVCIVFGIGLLFYCLMLGVDINYLLSMPLVYQLYIIFMLLCLVAGTMVYSGIDDRLIKFFKELKLKIWN